MTDYTYVAEALRDHFSFSSVVIGDPVGGFSTLNLACEADGRRYFLKCYADGDRERAERTSATYVHFVDGGVPVIAPLVSDNHGAICRAEQVGGSRFFCLLFPWSDGVVLDEATLTAPTRRRAATILGAIHGLDKVAPYPVHDLAAKVHGTTERIAALRKRNMSMIPEAHRVAVLELLALKERVIQRYDGALRPHAPVVLHGDYHPQNLLYTDLASAEAVVLDLDDVRIGHPFLDVVSFLSLACWNTGFTEHQLATAREFLSAYLTVRGLSSEVFREGFQFYLYDWCASFFMEEGVLSGRSELFPLVLRDCRKLAFYVQEEAALVQGLRC